jgi:cell pole-organizing protein PopZ
MEEILASIRRIIADDDALPLMRRPGPALVAREPAPAGSSAAVTAERRSDSPRHPPAPSPTAGPVHLMAVPLDGSLGVSDVAMHTDSVASHEEDALRDGVGDMFELRPSVSDTLPDEEDGHAPTIISSTPDNPSAVSGPPAADRDNGENTPLVSPSTDASVASSFQSLATSMFLRDSDLIARTAREMLRPMLKQWLDDNLPVMVERLVRAEIERVARGGR